MPVTSHCPQNYTVLNLITLIFCCFVFGLVGLKYSLQVTFLCHSTHSHTCTHTRYTCIYFSYPRAACLHIRGAPSSSFNYKSNTCTITSVIHSLFIQVDKEWNSGNHQGAQEASQKARKWATVGIMCGVPVIAVCVLLIGFPLVVAIAVVSDGSD